FAAAGTSAVAVRPAGAGVEGGAQAARHAVSAIVTTPGQIARIAKVHFGAIIHDNGHPWVAVPATLARASGGNRNSPVYVFRRGRNGRCRVSPVTSAAVRSVMSIFEAFRRAMLGLALIGALGILAAAVFLGYCAYTLPLTHGPAAETAPAATVYVSSLDKPIAARGVYRGEKLTADHLPASLAQAIVAI